VSESQTIQSFVDDVFRGRLAVGPKIKTRRSDHIRVPPPIGDDAGDVAVRIEAVIGEHPRTYLKIAEVAWHE
jgi:hypothetical protein